MPVTIPFILFSIKYVLFATQNAHINTSYYVSNQRSNLGSLLQHNENRWIIYNPQPADFFSAAFKRALVSIKVLGE